MLQQIMETDPLVRKLLEKAGFPTAQLETLLIHGRLLHINYSEQAKLRSGRAVSKGAYVRTLMQGKESLRKNIYRLILLNYLALVNENELLGIMSIIGMLNKIRDQGNSLKAEKVEEIMKSVDLIINSIV